MRKHKERFTGPVDKFDSKSGPDNPGPGTTDEEGGGQVGPKEKIEPQPGVRNKNFYGTVTLSLCQYYLRPKAVTTFNKFCIGFKKLSIGL